MFKFLLPLLLIAPLAHADVSVPRAKQYLWSVYDVALLGGSSTASKSLNVSMPAGAIITNAYVYINTQFAASGTESIGISCVGSQDIMGYNTVKNVSADRIFQGELGSNSYTGAAAPIPTPSTALNLSQGYGSVPSACGVTVNVRGDSGYTPYTAGKLTLIIEYFKL